MLKLNLRKKRKKNRSNWCNYSDDGETKGVAAAVDKTSGSVLLANLFLEENHLEKKKNMRRWKVKQNLMSGTRDGLDPIPGEEWWACETNVPIFSLLGVGVGQNSIQIQKFTDFYPFHRRGLVGTCIKNVQQEFRWWRVEVTVKVGVFPARFYSDE